MSLLRNKISKYLRDRFDVKHNEDEILLTVGSYQGIFATLMTTINPENENIATETTYICCIPDGNANKILYDGNENNIVEYL